MNILKQPLNQIRTNKPSTPRNQDCLSIQINSIHKTTPTRWFQLVSESNRRARDLLQEPQ